MRGLHLMFVLRLSVIQSMQDMDLKMKCLAMSTLVEFLVLLVGIGLESHLRQQGMVCIGSCPAYNFLLELATRGCILEG